MRSVLRDDFDKEQGWSRRRFLLTTVAAAASMPVAQAAAEAGTNETFGAGTSGIAERPLTIISAELALQERSATGASVLSGDRLARLQKMRWHLWEDRPKQVALHLDEADQLLWDVALGDAGVVATQRSRSQLFLDYRRAMRGQVSHRGMHA